MSEQQTPQSPEEKLAILKAAKGYQKEDYSIMIEWQDELSRLRAEESFVGHPVTKELAEIAQSMIDSIKEKLSSDEGLSDLERRQLFASKRAHEVYLALFTKNPSEAIALLEKKVDRELDSDGDY